MGCAGWVGLSPLRPDSVLRPAQSIQPVSSEKSRNSIAPPRVSTKSKLAFVATLSTGYGTLGDQLAPNFRISPAMCANVHFLCDFLLGNRALLGRKSPGDGPIWSRIRWNLACYQRVPIRFSGAARRQHPQARTHDSRHDTPATPGGGPRSMPSPGMAARVGSRRWMAPPNACQSWTSGPSQCLCPRRPELSDSL